MYDLPLLVSNFNILYAMVAMIWQFCVLIQAIFLLSIWKMMIIIVLFITFSNLKQLILKQLENSVLENGGYIRNIVSISVYSE